MIRGGPLLSSGWVCFVLLVRVGSLTLYQLRGGDLSEKQTDPESMRPDVGA